MFTEIFFVGYAIILIALGVGDCLHWVYTGVGEVEFIDNLMKILLSRLFLQILFPCLLIDMFISVMDDILDKINRLFAEFPEIDKSALGFPIGWANEPLLA